MAKKKDSLNYTGKELEYYNALMAAYDQVSNNIRVRSNEVLDRSGAAKRGVTTHMADVSSDSASHEISLKQLSEEYGILEVPAPKSWVGKTLKELNVRAKIGVNILAVRRQGKINVSPSADFAIEQGDILVILGDSQALKKVQKL